jgi:putative ABC transport system permease protein
MNPFNIKITLRRLSRNPLISFINLSGLALGVACAFLGISYAWQELNYEESFSDSDRIYRVGVDFMNLGGFAVGPEYLPEYLQTHSDAVEASSRVSVRGQIALEQDNRSVNAVLLACDTSYFDLFDFPVLSGNHGNLLSEPGQAVISSDLALRWFGELKVAGKEIELPLGDEKKIYQIGAVVERDDIFTHMIGDIWIPIQPFLKQERSWYSAAYYTYFKLKETADLPALESELEHILRDEIYESYGKSGGLSYAEWKQKPDAYRFIVQPLEEIHLKSGLNFEMSEGGNLQKIRGFLIIGLLILLVAVANYINLSTARSFTRIKEIGIKKSLGVNRFSLFRQFMSESLIESFFVVIASAMMMNAILKLFELWTGNTLLSLDHINYRQFSVFLLFTVVVGLLATLYPAIYLSSVKPSYLLKNQSEGYRNTGLRSILVVFQFAITTALICGSLVIFSQLKFMHQKDLGFDRDGLMVFENVESLGSSAETFRQKLASNPAVLSSTFAKSIPGGSSIYQSSYKTTEMESSLPIRTLPVDASFLPTMGIHLIEGQNFLEKPGEDSTMAIINESARNALGLTEAIGADISNGLKVIGVVSDFHIESLKTGIRPVVLQYTPMGDLLTLRLSGNLRPESLTGFIEETNTLWQQLNPRKELRYSFVDDTFRKFAEQEEIAGRGILALTVIALVIACMGLFGLSTFTLKKREKEIGIRKILGASISSIVGLVSRDFLRLVGLGLLIATPVAWYFMENWLLNFAYRIELNWWVFMESGAIAIFIALITVSVQSLRAALANPIESLRDD